MVNFTMDITSYNHRISRYKPFIKCAIRGNLCLFNSVQQNSAISTKGINGISYNRQFLHNA